MSYWDKPDSNSDPDTNESPLVEEEPEQLELHNVVRLPVPEMPSLNINDPYNSSMTSGFRKIHDYIYPRMFEKVEIAGTPLSVLHEHAASGPIIYATPQIGQLEYHLLNYILIEEDLPLASFANGLHTTGWGIHSNPTSVKNIIRKFRKELPPDPVRTGHLRNLLNNGESALIRLKTSILYDDLLWDDPEEDPLRATIQAAQDKKQEILIVPLQILWDKRPEKASTNLIDLIFGDRLSPGALRKAFMFLRYHAHQMQVKVGTPIPLIEFVNEQAPSLTLPELTRALRTTLLAQLQRERKATTGPALKPRRWMIEQTLADERLQKTIYKTARDTGKNIDELQQLARNMALEIATDVNYRYVEFIGRILNWFFKDVYNGIIFDENEINSVRDAIAKGPVVLVPNHRSHVDYLLVSHLLYQAKVALPYVAGGINMSFWPAGPIVRRGGAFFLRRTFKGNDIYKAVFEAYLHLLVHEGHCTEFFIEGGRSRTGKSLMPRMGMLSMFTQTMREGAANELRFIPVTITYDQVIESGAYLSELAGAKKKKESFWEMLRIRKHLRRRYGRIYVRFGEDIKFTEACTELWGKPVEPTSITDEQKPQITRHLAMQLMRQISKRMVVTPGSLAAFALLLPAKPAVTEEDLHTLTDRLADYLRHKAAPFSDLLSTKQHEAVDEALRRFSNRRFIAHHKEFQPHYYAVSPDKRMALDLNKNNIIHYFVSISCLSTIMRSHLLQGLDTVSYDLLKEDFIRCQSLFAHEFVFSRRLDTDEHLDKLLQYFSSRRILHYETRLSITSKYTAAAQLELFASILRNYFEAYQAVLLTIETLPESGIDERELLRETMQYAEHLLTLGVIHCPEACSHAIFTNALLSFNDLGIIRRVPTEQSKIIKIYKGSPESPLHILKHKLEVWCQSSAK